MRSQRAVILFLAGALVACGDTTTDLASDDAGPDDDGGDPPPPDDGCPPYQTLCDGVCVPTSVDPLNCGGCDVACTGDDACSAGGCSATCLEGTLICDNRCVDDKSDNEHCGGCDNPCEPGTGCVDGSCQPVVSLDDPPAECSDGGGPPPDIGEGDEQVCGGNLAEVTFRWALCSCTDIDLMNPFLTDAYSSTSGSYVPGILGGGVGLNGVFDSTSEVSVYGDLWGSAAGPFQTSNPLQVWQELHVGGDVNATGIATIGESAFVNGDVGATNPYTIADALHVPVGSSVSSNVSYAALVNEEVAVPPPCDCAPDQLVPVAAYIATARDSNDNAIVGLDPAVLNPTSGPARLDLSCGVYFLDAVSATAPLVIAVHGRTALFVEGDITSTSTLTITLDPTAELNLFVGGTIQTTDKLRIGSANYPALTRVYLGGAQSLTISNNTQIGAFVYAGYGVVEAVNELTVFGGLYGGDFVATDDVAIHYDRGIQVAGEDCPEDEPPPGGCESCLDCNNQACNDGVCGQCTDSSDCCAPLRCVEGECLAYVE